MCGKEFFMTKKHYKKYKSKKGYKGLKQSHSRYGNNKRKYKESKHQKIDGYNGDKYPYKSDKLNWKNQHRTSSYYIDKDGKYKQKPFFVNFFKEGFGTDVPTRKDYDRIMEGKLVDVEPGQKVKNLGGGWVTTQVYEDDDLFGLERLQLSIKRLWNGSPREWLKLLMRICILLLMVGLFALLFNCCVA